MSATAVEVPQGRQVRSIREPVAGDAAMVNVGAGGAASAITIVAPAASSGRFILIERVDWSYSAAPTGGRLTITDGTSTFFDIDITAAGPGFAEVYRRITKETNAIVTLAAPGGAVVGKLNVVARLIQ